MGAAALRPTPGWRGASISSEFHIYLLPHMPVRVSEKFPQVHQEVGGQLSSSSCLPKYSASGSCLSGGLFGCRVSGEAPPPIPGGSREGDCLFHGRRCAGDFRFVTPSRPMLGWNLETGS